MTRHGKIARLPRRVRDELNRRLDDGVPGKKLVAWLNSLPDVRDVLEVEFQSQPINEQNVSAWKNGGYQDWQQAQAAGDLARGLSERAEAIDHEAGEASMADHASSLVALLLARMVAAVTDKSLRPGRSRRQFFDLIDALNRLRRTDQMAARLRMKRDWHERELRAARAKDPTDDDRIERAIQREDEKKLRTLSHVIGIRQSFGSLMDLAGITDPAKREQLWKMTGLFDSSPPSSADADESAMADSDLPMPGMQAIMADQGESRSIKEDQAA